MDLKPNIAIISTGGTITGSANSILSTKDYEIGKISIQNLLNSIPIFQSIANISLEEIVHIDSANMSNAIWIDLAHKTNNLLESPNIDGVVITHGSDTLEESAYFLHLVIKSHKPVVFTGAMRPPSATGSDALKNLYNAISLAGHKEASNKGVMVVMNDKIYSAREVSKTHTLNLESFSAPNSGAMGYIVDGEIFFHTMPLKSHTQDTPFSIKDLQILPKVDIVYSYCDDGSKVAVKAFLKAGSKGLVVAGSGAGSIHKDQKDYLIQLLQKQAIVIVKSSRVGAGLVPLTQEERKQGFISANNLNPQKARVLLMLALTKTKAIDTLREYFKKY
ncbi:asparaginase [Helicobacter mesocricetorum]|uniref:asparaginase n=1 Tax=Helicobacter mesocricetorum TaxID=87012 RepID=UPI000CF1705A|nr:asparaginase [Helicobacter mesocricetorum]